MLNKHLFLTAKPVIYLVNLSERDYIRKKNKWYIHKNRCLCVECIQLSSNIAATVQCVQMAANDENAVYRGYSI